MEIKKVYKARQTEWLETEAKERAVAAGEKDWEKRLEDMVWVAESRAINRKLGTITKTKGRHSQALDWIEASTHDWFHLKKNNEIYHYDNGNFEAYPATGSGTFHSHHSLKVISADATQILVKKEEGQWMITQHLEWYYSDQTKSLYHRKEGKLMQYQVRSNGTCGEYMEHPTPKDARAATVIPAGEGYRIT